MAGKLLFFAGASFLVTLLACQTPTASPTPTPSPTATATSTPTATATPQPTATPVPPTATAVPATATPVPPPTAAPAPVQPAPAAPPAVAPAAAGVERGRMLYATVGCAACHGRSGEGFIGPRIANTGLSFQQVLAQVRNPVGAMESFSPATLSDADVQSIYQFLKSLP